MREIMGFAAGVTVATAAGVLLRSEAGRRLVRELARDADPDLRRAADEWQPLLREVSRAARLGIRELATAVETLDGHLARLASEATATAEAEATATAAAAADDPPDPPVPDRQPSDHAAPDHLGHSADPLGHR